MNIVECINCFNQYQYIYPYIKVVLVVIAAFFIIDLIRKFTKRFLDNRLLPIDVQFLLRRIIIYFLWFVVLMYITIELKLEEIFLPLMGASILAGAAIALAVKDVLADAVAGVFLLLDRHFNIGDNIKTMGYSGEIFDVTLRKTRIKTDDGTIVILPNGKIDSSGWVLYINNIEN